MKLIPYSQPRYRCERVMPTTTDQAIIRAFACVNELATVPV
jgi:hypothetical protein